MSCFYPISGPISCTYRVQTVSRHSRYRVFHRYRARYGPDIANNITIYGNHVQKNTTSSPMCLQYHNIRISGTFRCRGVYMMSGTICHLLPVRLRPPPPALARRSDWSSLRICPGAPTWTGTQHCRVQQPARNVEFSSLLRLLSHWVPGPACQWVASHWVASPDFKLL